MLKRWFPILTLLLAGFANAQPGPDSYNIVWNSPSKNASESMPCGGGDIGLNVWVEKGDLLIYATQSGSLNEDNNLMKAGRLRIRLLPNPFDGKIFRQELLLQDGYITIEGENNGIRATAKIWVNVFSPVAHIDITANKKIRAEAVYESWRYRDRLLVKRESFSNSWKWAPPDGKSYTRDSIAFWGEGVRFFHNNGPRTVFDTTVAQQGLNAVKDQLYNPVKNRVFGGLFWGRGFIPDGIMDSVYEQTDYRGWKLRSRTPATTQQLNLALYVEQDPVTTPGLELPLWELKTNLLKTDAGDKTAFSRTREWWRAFWSRSFIRVSPASVNSEAWKVGRNYQLFRYMLGCNARSNWPTKFNGGLFTVDPLYTDTGNKGLTPDYRNWGGGVHTAQNQRLVYFPMIRSGDWDLLQSQFDFYLRILKNAELRTKVYWGHEGACFTEQMENFGLPNYAEYGTRRPENFDKGVEYNAWLEYEWDTVLEFCLMMLEETQYTGRDLADRLPFIESCVKFFYEHYAYEARKRTARPFDNNGKLTFFPGSGAETFKVATNSTATLAALQTIINRLLALPVHYLSKTKRDHYDSLLKRTPPLSFGSFNGHPTIAPAKSWERINNEESPQLYPVFPWGLYGVGKPGLDTAVNTWKYDTNVIRFRSHKGWKQDNIWAARLGLSDEAWQLTRMKFEDAPRRFPAFWGPGFDWVPDHNWGGSAMIGLQEMLIQTDDKRILLFPAWPREQDVHFKLHAPYNTTVEAEWKNGKLVMLKVIPEVRQKDVEVLLN